MIKNSLNLLGFNAEVVSKNISIDLNKMLKAFESQGSFYAISFTEENAREKSITVTVLLRQVFFSYDTMHAFVLDFI